MGTSLATSFETQDRTAQDMYPLVGLFAIEPGVGVIVAKIAFEGGGGDFLHLRFVFGAKGADLDFGGLVGDRSLREIEGVIDQRIH